jgi:hypothetical protein
VSYDVWLTIDTGGPVPAIVTESRNMTSNVAPMWRAAGAQLHDFHGEPANLCAPALRDAIARMLADPDTYRAMAPANGWGSYDGCIRYLQALADDFEAHPLATVAVSR